MTREAPDTQSENAKLKAKLNLLLALLSHAQHELQQQKGILGDRLNEREARVRKLDDDVEDRNQRIGELDIELRRRNDRIQLLETALARLDEHFRQMESELKRQLQQQSDSFSAAQDAFNATLADFKHSTSWRLTAPLRLLVQLVNRRH